MAQQKKIKNHIKADHILKNFWKDNSRFADLFNACIFDGEQVLKPNDLTEVDTDISSLLQFNGHAETIQKVLDVVKKTAFGIDWYRCCGIVGPAPAGRRRCGYRPRCKFCYGCRPGYPLKG